jgi:CBS domain-containing protein
MKVRDVMQRHVITVAEDESLGRAQQQMLWSGIRHLPVRRKPDGRVIGVISERDVLRSYKQLGAEPDGFNRPVSEFMTRPAEHIHPDAELADAAADLTTRRIGCLPVIEVGALVGIITASDLLGSLAQYPADYRAKQRRAAQPAASVASIMYPEPIAVHRDDLVVTLAARLAQAGVRHACVVDGTGCVTGIVSDRDLRRVLGDPMRALFERTLPAPVRELRVGQIMTANPRTILQDDPISLALSLLSSTRFGALPVVDERDRLRGIVSYLDVLKYFEEASASGALGST